MSTRDYRDKSRAHSLRRWMQCGWLGFFLTASSLPATSVIAPTFDRLVKQADYVVRAVVKSVTSEITSDGGQRHIITKVNLDVREVIRGTPPQPLVLQMLGGRVGGEEMIVEGAPRFKAGDEDILFVHGNGVNMNPLVALMHGRYPIKRDGTGREYMTRSNGALLRSEQEVAQPMGSGVTNESARAAAPMLEREPSSALSPAEFTSRIRAVVNSHGDSKLEH